jgi:Fe-S cluster assembly scaffold protein SufB
MLEWRLEAFRRWKEMDEPTWAMVHYPKIDYQDAHYYAEPKGGAKYKSIADVPQEILDTYTKLGIPLKEQEVLLGVEGAMETAAAARETPRVASSPVPGTLVLGRPQRPVTLSRRSAETLADIDSMMRSSAVQMKSVDYNSTSSIGATSSIVSRVRLGPPGGAR